MMNEDDIRDMQSDAQLLVDQFDDLLREMASNGPIASYNNELGWHVMVDGGKICYTESTGAFVAGGYQRELQVVLQEAKDREANLQQYDVSHAEQIDELHDKLHDGLVNTALDKADFGQLSSLAHNMRAMNEEAFDRQQASKQADPPSYVDNIQEQSKHLVDKLTTPKAQAQATPAEHSVEGTTPNPLDKELGQLGRGIALGEAIAKAIVTFVREGTL